MELPGPCVGTDYAFFRPFRPPSPGRELNELCKPSPRNGVTYFESRRKSCKRSKESILGIMGMLGRRFPENSTFVLASAHCRESSGRKNRESFRWNRFSRSARCCLHRRGFSSPSVGPKDIAAALGCGSGSRAHNLRRGTDPESWR